MILMALMSSPLNFSITAMLCGSFSFPSSNSGFTISSTLFLERLRSILVFHALRLETPSNLFSTSWSRSCVVSPRPSPATDHVICKEL
jgi:hypothetical protein